MPAKNLTDKQERIWREKMQEQERRLIRFYNTYGAGTPDGSFMMSAFKSGYYLRQRSASESDSKRGRNPKIIKCGCGESFTSREFRAHVPKCPKRKK